MNKRFILKKNEEIGKLVKLKKSVGNKYYIIYYNEGNEGPKVAISVSKKYGNAVIRNYEKRVTKEVIRNIVPTLPKIDILIVIKKNLKEIDFQEKKRQLNYLIKKMIKNIGERKSE